MLLSSKDRGDVTRSPGGHQGHHRLQCRPAARHVHPRHLLGRIIAHRPRSGGRTVHRLHLPSKGRLEPRHTARVDGPRRVRRGDHQQEQAHPAVTRAVLGRVGPHHDAIPVRRYLSISCN